MEILDVDSMYWKRRFERLEKILDDMEMPESEKIVTVECYKNKKLLGVTYHDKIENKLKVFDNLVEKYEGHPEWVKYLD